MRIILDAMGGDNAPQAPVIGALQAAKDFGADLVIETSGRESAMVQAIKMTKKPYFTRVLRFLFCFWQEKFSCLLFLFVDIQNIANAIFLW